MAIVNDPTAIDSPPDDRNPLTVLLNVNGRTSTRPLTTETHSLSY